MEVLQLVPQLGKALWSLKLMYQQDAENERETKELQSFIKDYEEQIPTLEKRFQESGGNALGMVAFKILEKDVMEATKKLERWSKDKSFFRMFTCAERMQKLEKLHFKIMASVQKSLGITSVFMLLDLQATQASIVKSNASILESNVELKSLLISSIGKTSGTLPTGVREEVVEASTSPFCDSKFWEEVLVAVDSHGMGISVGEKKSMYEDPITAHLMIDPVVASDGNTYCRWTIIDNNWTTNPCNVKEKLSIVVDNLTFRRGLFESFPEQYEIFRQRRMDYRTRALSLKAKGSLGDAALALSHVLEWDKQDVECIEALEEVQGALEGLKGKYLQASKEPSIERGVVGPIESGLKETVAIEPPVDLGGAYILFLDLSSSDPEVLHRALAGVYHWAAKDDEYLSYIIANGAVRLLTSLIASSDPITQERALSLLFHVSLQFLVDPDKVAGHFADEPVASVTLVLKEGSDDSSEQASRILFNYYYKPESDEKFSVGPYTTGCLEALFTSIGARPPRLQQIQAGLLHLIFENSYNINLKESWVDLLVGLMTDQPTTMLEEGLPLLNELLSYTDTLDTFRVIIEAKLLPSVLVNLVASASAVHQERAASLLCTLCSRSKEYREQAIQARAIQRFSELVQSTTLKGSLSKIARLDFRSSTHLVIPFPEKKWWYLTDGREKLLAVRQKDVDIPSVKSGGMPKRRLARSIIRMMSCGFV